jgi:ubiquinol-cytochrome c reductase cytochrome b subunit
LILLPIAWMPYSKFRGTLCYPLSKAYYWTLIITVLLLTWIGARPVEEPYVIVGQCLTVYYFLFYVLRFTLKDLWDDLTN